MSEAATRAGVEFLDTATLIATSDLDGIHLDEISHGTLGAAVTQRIRRMLGSSRSNSAG
jgi:hypothetical protein